MCTVTEMFKSTKIDFKRKIIKWQIIFQNCVPMILLDLTQQ